ncbi:DUF1800 domain-containing protein [Methylobacterium sp. Leaf93]|uniref:DUF1800 domain-containing protein n=1 Tax=Methylobacterium sp. Leaf93 TaxID=1736249 RepID=UPI000ACE1C4C|nr:DUF1800 domain-containing protein [Methylobacterium sp. Leaf93]
MSRNLAFSNAVGRFGLGCGAIDLPAVDDPRGYVRAQLDMPLTAPDAKLMSSSDQLQAMMHRRQVARKRREAMADAGSGNAMVKQGGAMQDGSMAMEPRAEPSMGGGMMENEPEAKVTQGPLTKGSDELIAWLRLAAVTKAPLHERLFLHWSNHFTVGVGKGKSSLTAGSYQREAIRPFILGRFHDMAKAAILHASMLYYLDNASSVGPDSKVGRIKKSGLNENLGREVLELHTLGVDGGYSQADVTALASVLTGWTVDLKPQSETFGEVVFRERQHQPGPKTILGKRYAEAGADEFLTVLTDLARHPSTARYVTRRMARAFVSEKVSDLLQNSLAKVFRESDGDLKAVTAALVQSDEAWTAAPVKLRPPIEFLAATARMIGRVPLRPSPVASLLAMGQPFLAAPSPKGWAEEDDAWVTSDGIKSRIDWAQQCATLNADHVDIRKVVDDRIGGYFSDETRRVIRQGESPEQALALLMLSPEFQRR